MNCPITNKPCSKPKTIHVTDILNGEPYKFELCDECGVNLIQDLNIKKTENAKSLMPPNISALISMIDKLVEENAVGIQTYECPKCGFSYENLAKTSRFGCANCYTFFAEYAVDILARCQVGLNHIGKTPTNLDCYYVINTPSEKIALLNEKLKRAIDSENYEIAAIIKNKIKELENEGRNEV